MKFSCLFLFSLLLSSCIVRTGSKVAERRPAALDSVMSILPEPQLVTPLEPKHVITVEEKMMRANIEVVAEMKVEKVMVEQIVAQPKVNVQQKQVQQHVKQQVQQKKVQTQQALKAFFSTTKSRLEFKKPLISGPSQFDSRIEPSMLNLKSPWQKKIHDNALSIGIIVEKDKLHAVTDTSFQLEISMTLQTRYKLCPDEPFADQPVIGVGTAFIVGKNTMVTASHVFMEPIENYVVVFGFEMSQEKGKFNTLISKDRIYQPKLVTHKDNDVDLVIFEVAEPISRPPLVISSQSNPALATEIYMIGYPSGLPEKIALNADVLENNHPQYFYTSLDAFQGNSGSPVFNMATHEVIGVLVSGEVDYVWNGSCNKSSLCQFPYCKGEKVMKISALTEQLSR